MLGIRKLNNITSECYVILQLFKRILMILTYVLFAIFKSVVGLNTNKLCVTASYTISITFSKSR